MEPILLRIEGMTCASCVSRLERALGSVPGVKSASINLTTEIATIEKSGDALSPPILLEAVRNAGYDAEPVRRADETTTTLERTKHGKLLQQKRALLHAVSTGVPILALHWLSPILISSEAGGPLWPVVIQALLCGMLLKSAAGAPILVGGLRAVIHRSPNMDLLIAIGVSAAFVSGISSLFSNLEHPADFYAVALILIFINGGRLLEMRAKHQTASAISALARRIPSTALIVTADGTKEVPVDSIAIADHVRIPQDAVVPVDGVILEGQASIDLSAITGEPLPRLHVPGDEVPSGGVIKEGMITLEAQRVGAASAIGRIIRAVEAAQSGKTRMQRIADRVAGVFVPIVVAAAAIALFGNVWTTSSWSVAVERAIAVLVIACPCAMGLATPTAVAVATGTAALRGILVRDPATLEAAAQIDVMLLDKTGTLTTGCPVLSEVVPVGDDPPEREARELVRLAACAEFYAQHPLAVAIIDQARRWDLLLTEPTQYENKVGKGVIARVEGRQVCVGAASLIDEVGVGVPDSVRRQIEDSDRTGSVVFVAVDDQYTGYIILTDEIRPDARSAIEAINRLGIHTAIITGDQTASARVVADRLGIDECHAEMTPENKQELVRQRREAGHRVAFVGDGINDAPALASADVGITFSSATDVAAGAADITILHENLERLATTILIARRSVRIIKQNLFWAFFYNFLAVPLAAVGAVPPGYAAAAMMVSSISVVLNSLRLKRRTIEHRPA